MRFLFVLICFALLSSPLVLAGAGMDIPPIEQRTFIYQPGASYTWSWPIYGAAKLETYLQGDLTQYATLNDPAPNTSNRVVTFSLNPPPDLAPGRYVLYLIAREFPPAGVEGLGARAAAGGGIVIISLYPTPFVDASITANNVAVGQPANATLTLQSWSKVDAPNVYADLTVFDENNTVVLTTRTDSITVPSQKAVTVLTPLPTDRLPIGTYRIQAVVHNAQSAVNASSQFRLGSFDISLYDYQHALTIGTINKFAFTVSSNWNQDMSQVYGVVRLGNVQDRSVTLTLPGFGQEDFTAYLDLTGLNVSNGTVIPGTIAVYVPTSEFLDRQTFTIAGNDAYKTFPINVTIVSQPLPETQVKPRELEAAKGGFLTSLNLTTVMYIGLLLLLIAMIIFLLLRQRPANPVTGPPK